MAPVGFVLVLFAAASLYLDLNTRLYLLRRLFFRRAPRTSSPPAKPPPPARLILCAHYDAAKTGLVFGPRSTKAAKRLSETSRVLFGPIRLIFWAGIVPLLLLSAARMAGIESQGLAILQLLPTAILLISLALLIDIALSGSSPAPTTTPPESPRCSRSPRQLDAEPPRNLDVWVVLPGAEECNCEGHGRWMRPPQGTRPRTTAFVNLDSVSFGDPHYLASEGAIVSYRLDRRLVELCEAIAAADREERQPLPGAADPHPVPHRRPAGQHAPLAGDLGNRRRGRRQPAHYHTHADTPDKLDEEAMTRTVEFTLELVHQIDRDVGRGHSASE